MTFSLNHAIVVMVVALGVFAAIMALLPSQLIAHQTDYVSPATQSQEVVSYFSANNITQFKNTWAFDIEYGTMVSNASGMTNGHRVEFYWLNIGTVLGGEDAVIYVKHAFPSPLGDWWLWYNVMGLIEPYKTKAGSPAYFWIGPNSIDGNIQDRAIEKPMLVRLQTSANASYFEVSDGEITSNFVVMNGNQTAYGNLTQSWDGHKLHVLSSYEIDWDAMKPNAWWLLAQMVTFQAPDLGIPGQFGELLTYIFGLGFWVVVAIIIYTIATRLLPTLRGGVEG